MEQTGAVQGRAAQSGLEYVELSRPDQSRAELFSWRGASFTPMPIDPGPPHRCAIPQPCCFITELFTLNEVFFFTTPQIRESWISGGSGHTIVNEHKRPTG